MREFSEQDIAEMADTDRVTLTESERGGSQKIRYVYRHDCAEGQPGRKLERVI